jgi:hypothetical protein
MEIMKKNLRSVQRNSENRYEYFRVDVEEAARLMSIGGYVYISKEEYKRQSKFYNFELTNGTIINHFDNEGNKSQECLNNYNFGRSSRQNSMPSSTKIANCSSSVSEIKRKNKYAIKHKTILKQARSAKRELKLNKVVE